MNTETIRHLLAQLLKNGLGFNLKDPNLVDTPKRIAKMYSKEWFAGVGTEFDNFKAFPNVEGYEQIITFDNIHFSSICSHHFLPFNGLAWLNYIPGERLVGSSKPARLVEHYAARPQLQENLTHQVLNRFVEKIKPKGAQVVMRCLHQCMICRGVKQSRAGMITDALSGCFFEPDVKMEGLEVIKLSLMM